MILLLALACAPPRFEDPARVLLIELDADGSGLLDPAELGGVELRPDFDGDGRWNAEELRTAMARAAAAAAVPVDPRGGAPPAPPTSSPAQAPPGRGAPPAPPPASPAHAPPPG